MLRVLCLFLVALFYSSTASAGPIDDFRDWVNTKLDSIVAWFKSLVDSIITAVSDFIRDMWDVILIFFKSIMLTAFEMLKDLFAAIFDIMLVFLVGMLNAFGSLVQSLDILRAFDIPPHIANILGLIGIGPACGMIATALVIRMGLQLVPFTRLGS